MNPFAKNQQPSKAGGDDLFTDLLVHNSNTKPKKKPLNVWGASPIMDEKIRKMKQVESKKKEE